MISVSVRLHESLHKLARELATKENIAIDQFIAMAVEEKMSALLAGEYLEKRAARGSRARFKQALARVADREPAERDHIRGVPAMASANVFMTGRSQAVRLPKAYRLDTDEVLIERQPDGAILLRPKPKLPPEDSARAAYGQLPTESKRRGG